MKVQDDPRDFQVDRGLKFAVGRHVEGHLGVIHRSPYGTHGATLGIRHKRKRTSDPWICLCDRLEAAYESAVSYTGPGWSWHPIEGNAEPTAHARLSVMSTAPVFETSENEQRLSLAMRALSDLQLPELPVINVRLNVGHDPRRSPYFTYESGQGWFNHWVTLTIAALPPVVHFRTHVLTETAKLVLCDVVG